MPNRKISAETKKLRGTYRPGLDNKNAPISTETLGSAPSHMSDQEKKIWSEISAKLPPRTATGADSLAFEVLTKLVARFRTESLTGTEITQLMRILSKFGLTPQDRNSVEPVPPPRGPSKWGK